MMISGAMRNGAAYLITIGDRHEYREIPWGDGCDPRLAGIGVGICICAGTWRWSAGWWWRWRRLRRPRDQRAGDAASGPDHARAEAHCRADCFARETRREDGY